MADGYDGSGLRRGAGKYIRGIFSRHGLVMRDVARAARIDPSYVALIRDGDIPREPISRRLVAALTEMGVPEIDAERWMLLCGRVPPSLSEASEAFIDAVLRVTQRPVMQQRIVASAMLAAAEYGQPKHRRVVAS